MDKILTIKQINNLEETAKISFVQLMENAGKAVFNEIKKTYGKCKVVVLCGPGNNGGDGYAVAVYMLSEGWDVKVFLNDVPNCCEYKVMYDKWNKIGGKSLNFKYVESDAFAGVDLIVDAMFGTGINKNITGEYKKMIGLVNSMRIPVVSIDLPSGINGDSGKIMGVTIKANETITFTALKLAHVIMPSKEYCGKINVIDIGILAEDIEKLDIKIKQNSPSLWKDFIPKVKIDDDKYSRGMVLINSGEMHGATILASRGAEKVGVGIVYIACDNDNYKSLACHAISEVLKKANNIKEYEDLLRDGKTKVVLLGPGNGKTETLKEKIFSTLKFGDKVVFDADAISVFENDKNGAEALFKKTSSKCVFTPHVGEFEKLFDYDQNDKISSVLDAAKKSKSVVMLKGYDTIIASPSGEVVINTNASPYLSIAGSGDVLSGMIAGLISRGMDEFKATCCAVWLHGEASLKIGRIFNIRELIDSVSLDY